MRPTTRDQSGVMSREMGNVEKLSPENYHYQLRKPFNDPTPPPPTQSNEGRSNRSCLVLNKGKEAKKRIQYSLPSPWIDEGMQLRSRGWTERQSTRRKRVCKIIGCACGDNVYLPLAFVEHPPPSSSTLMMGGHYLLQQSLGKDVEGIRGRGGTRTGTRISSCYSFWNAPVCRNIYSDFPRKLRVCDKFGKHVQHLFR